MTEKYLNNTCKEVLPDFLDKSKCQTIRRGWENCKQCDKGYLYHNEEHPKVNCPNCHGTFRIDKPAKFKVGDNVKIYWDKDNQTKHQHIWKELGVVEITEVFQIEIRKIGECQFRYVHSEHWWSQEGGRALELAESDGFKSAKDMFKYFDKQYDLSEPRKFWVYRWRWLE